MTPNAYCLRKGHKEKAEVPILSFISALLIIYHHCISQLVMPKLMYCMIQYIWDFMEVCNFYSLSVVGLFDLQW